MIEIISTIIAGIIATGLFILLFRVFEKQSKEEKKREKQIDDIVTALNKIADIKEKNDNDEE